MPLHRARPRLALPVAASLCWLSACLPPSAAAARDCAAYARVSPPMQLATSWPLSSVPLAQTAVGRGQLRLHGEVRDDSSGQPIAGAVVFLGGTNRGATTDSVGRFVILSPGSVARHLVVARRIGFASREDSVALPLPAGQMLLVRLRPRPMRLDDPCGGGLPHTTAAGPPANESLHLTGRPRRLPSSGQPLRRDASSRLYGARR